VCFGFGWRCEWFVVIAIADGTKHCAVTVVFYKAAFLLQFIFI
jgi:hypothetical protein